MGVVIDSPRGEFTVCPSCFSDPPILRTGRKLSEKKPKSKKQPIDGDCDPLL